MPRQLHSSSCNHRQNTSSQYSEATAMQCVDWQSTQELLGLDDLYNDSTAFLALTTDGDESLSNIDSAFYQNHIAQTPQERRAIMREERERMRAMCFTFRADPFSHRHANLSDGTTPISLYPAQPHTTPPLLYSFPVDAASYSGDEGSDHSGSGPFADIDTAVSESSSPPSVSELPNGECEPAHHFIFPSTSSFSVSSGSSSPVSSRSPQCDRLPYVKREMADWPPPTAWPHVGYASPSSGPERDPIYPIPLAPKPEFHGVVKDSSSLRSLQQLGVGSIALQLTQGIMGVDSSLLGGSTPVEGARGSREPHLMPQSSPFYSRPDKLAYSQPPLQPSFHAPPAVSYRSWMDPVRPPRRIPTFYPTVVAPHQNLPDPFGYP